MAFSARAGPDGQAQRTDESHMPTRYLHELSGIRATRTFLSILTAVFVVEATVMVALPHLIRSKSGLALRALLDASLLTLVLAPVLWFLIAKPLKKLAASRQRLLALTLSAQEDERRRIARDLHDGFGQSLASLMVGLRLIEEWTAEERVKAQARDLRRIGGDAHDELRRLARGLRPAILDDMGLVPALERLLEELSDTHAIEARLDPACQDEARLPADVEVSVYRIVQEAANNAVRHGQAKHLWVRLRCDASRLHVDIDDDGCGFDVAASLRINSTHSPFGLLSIRERAGLLGGRADFSSQPGRGSHVQVDIPLNHSEAAHG